jgi:RNA polymerase sigma factor (sigma-70 family)
MAKNDAMLGEEFPGTLEAARTGAEWAWERIYRELAPPLVGYLRGRGAPDPEDLTGEVFLQVVRDLHGFAGGERDFRAWVFVIAHHRLLDERRRRDRRPVEIASEPLEETGTDEADEAALRQVATQRVRCLLGQLTPDQQEVILLRVFGDLAVDDVARVLGKTPGAVKALQRRGLEGVLLALSKEGVTR